MRSAHRSHYCLIGLILTASLCFGLDGQFPARTLSEFGLQTSPLSFASRPACSARIRALEYTYGTSHQLNSDLDPLYDQQVEGTSEGASECVRVARFDVSVLDPSSTLDESWILALVQQPQDDRRPQVPQVLIGETASLPPLTSVLRPRGQPADTLFLGPSPGAASALSLSTGAAAAADAPSTQLRAQPTAASVSIARVQGPGLAGSLTPQITSLNGALCPLQRRVLGPGAFQRLPLDRPLLDAYLAAQTDQSASGRSSSRSSPSTGQAALDSSAAAALFLGLGPPSAPLDPASAWSLGASMSFGSIPFSLDPSVLQPQTPLTPVEAESVVLVTAPTPSPSAAAPSAISGSIASNATAAAPSVSVLLRIRSNVPSLLSVASIVVSYWADLDRPEDTAVQCLESNLGCAFLKTSIAPALPHLNGSSRVVLLSFAPPSPLFLQGQQTAATSQTQLGSPFSSTGSGSTTQGSESGSNPFPSYRDTTVREIVVRFTFTVAVATSAAPGAAPGRPVLKERSLRAYQTDYSFNRFSAFGGVLQAAPSALRTGLLQNPLWSTLTEPNPTMAAWIGEQKLWGTPAQDYASWLENSLLKESESDVYESAVGDSDLLANATRVASGPDPSCDSADPSPLSCLRLSYFCCAGDLSAVRRLSDLPLYTAPRVASARRELLTGPWGRDLLVLLPAAVLALFWGSAGYLDQSLRKRYRGPFRLVFVGERARGRAPLRPGPSLSGGSDDLAAGDSPAAAAEAKARKQRAVLQDVEAQLEGLGYGTAFRRAQSPAASPLRRRLGSPPAESGPGRLFSLQSALSGGGDASFGFGYSRQLYKDSGGFTIDMRPVSLGRILRGEQVSTSGPGLSVGFRPSPEGVSPQGGQCHGHGLITVTPPSVAGPSRGFSFAPPPAPAATRTCIESGSHEPTNAIPSATSPEPEPLLRAVSLRPALSGLQRLESILERSESESYESNSADVSFSRSGGLQQMRDRSASASADFGSFSALEHGSFEHGGSNTGTSRGRSIDLSLGFLMPSLGLQTESDLGAHLDEAGKSGSIGDPDTESELALPNESDVGREASATPPLRPAHVHGGQPYARTSVTVTSRSGSIERIRGRGSAEDVQESDSNGDRQSHPATSSSIPQGLQRSSSLPELQSERHPDAAVAPPSIGLAWKFVLPLRRSSTGDFDQDNPSDSDSVRPASGGASRRLPSPSHHVAIDIQPSPSLLAGPDPSLAPPQKGKSLPQHSSVLPPLPPRRGKTASGSILQGAGPHAVPALNKSASGSSDRASTPSFSLSSASKVGLGLGSGVGVGTVTPDVTSPVDVGLPRASSATLREVEESLAPLSARLASTSSSRSIAKALRPPIDRDEFGARQGQSPGPRPGLLVGLEATATLRLPSDSDLQPDPQAPMLRPLARGRSSPDLINTSCPGPGNSTEDKARAVPRAESFRAVASTRSDHGGLGLAIGSTSSARASLQLDAFAMRGRGRHRSDSAGPAGPLLTLSYPSLGSVDSSSATAADRDEQATAGVPGSASGSATGTSQVQLTLPELWHALSRAFWGSLPSAVTNASPAPSAVNTSGATEPGAAGLGSRSESGPDRDLEADVLHRTRTEGSVRMPEGDTPELPLPEALLRAFTHELAQFHSGPIATSAADAGPGPVEGRDAGTSGTSGIAAAQQPPGTRPPAVHQVEQVASMPLEELVLPTPIDPAAIRTARPAQIDLKNDVTLGKMIGRGSFGFVFAGTWRGQQVAVKVMNSGSRVDVADLRESLKKELRLLSICRHPNIVRCFGGNLDPTTSSPCIVQELVSGGSLDGLLHPRGGGAKPLPYGTLLEVLFQVASALAYLHPRVLHRDLKPGNVLLTKEGKVKLVDFGLSLFADVAQSFVEATGGAMGTTSYIAPECLTSEGPGRMTRVTDKIDIYALGIIAWECFTGQRPYTDRGYDWRAQVLVLKDVLGGLRPDIPEGCPEALARLMRRCWAANPAERPSALDVARRLQGLILEHSRLFKEA